MSFFQWSKLGLCSNWCLFNKNYTFSLNEGNFSTIKECLLSGGVKMRRRKGTTDHYRITCTEDRRSTSRSEMELVLHTEAADTSKTFWQRWCTPRLCRGYSTERGSYESKLDKTVCWERSFIRQKMPFLGGMHEQKLVCGRDVVKVCSGIILEKMFGDFHLQQWVTKKKGTSAEVWCWGMKWCETFTKLENSDDIFQG